MSNVELLPCPFCGEGEHLLVEHLEGTILHPAHRIRCDNCGSSTGYTDRDFRADWNTRTNVEANRRSGPIRVPGRGAADCGSVMDANATDNSNACPKCGDQMESDKFSDAVCIGSFYFDVHITACPGCGYVNDDRTWVE